jgi:hypothetical protein
MTRRGYYALNYSCAKYISYEEGIFLITVQS